jgi:anaerobic selenocysteine-containing dehydrogenase
MNWDRRAFVKFAVGAVVGLHASPLIPKLMDDSAIWTQNWSWVPNPEDGGLAFANTVNPATGTGVRVRLIQGRVTGERLVRVEGNPQHPVSQGGVIPADASAVQLLYNDEVRVSAPMLRDKKTGMYKQVSWEQALNMVAGKLSELSKAGKAHTVAALGDDADSIYGDILARFMAAYGSPNLAFSPQADDTLALAAWALTGQQEVGFDLAGANYIISFGTPLLEGFGAPVAVRKAFVEWKKNKATLVQVEPRCSVTASQADLFLGCKPGTEALVALGLAAIMVEQGLVDESAAGAQGMAEFKALLAKEYAPKKVAELSGVPVEKLIQVAKAFAKNPKALAVCGPGPGGDPGRLGDFLAVLALNALKGNLGKPGGLVARKPLGLKALGEPISVDKPRLDGGKKGMKPASALALAKAALAGQPYKVNMLLVAGGNPAYAGPQAGVMGEFLSAVPFVVAITPLLDETAALADLVLPANTFLEAWADCRTPYGSPVSSYGVARPLVKPYPEAKSVGDTLLALAAKLGGTVAQALPFASVEDALKLQAGPLGDPADLAKKVGFTQDKPAYGGFAFKTPSGRLDFTCQNLAGLLGKAPEGATMLPHWEKPAALAHGSGHGLLLAAAPSLRSAVGAQPLTPHMLKVLGEDSLRHNDELVVEINPQTAHALHLAENDKVTLTSAVGSVEARVYLYAGAAPGMVFMPTGLGHSAVSDAYTLNKGGNFHRVAEAQADSLSGLPTWGLTQVAVSKRG